MSDDHRKRLELGALLMHARGALHYSSHYVLHFTRLQAYRSLAVARKGRPHWLCLKASVRLPVAERAINPK